MLVIETVLALALVVVVPLAAGLDRIDRRGQVVLVAAGTVGAASLWLERGTGAAGIAVVWLVTVLGFAVPRLWERRRSIAGLVETAPLVYLAVGAGWLVLSSYGARPLGFGDTIVTLTAVHFHYAGFVASALVLGLPGTGMSLVVSRAAVLAATPITAAGITIHPVLGALGAVLFVVALSIYAWHVVNRIGPRAPSKARPFLYVSALSILAGIALGCIYALGQWLGTPAPTIEVMARTHGVLNALGFCLCGVLGRQLATAGPFVETT